jgi:hypothetical protein
MLQGNFVKIFNCTQKFKKSLVLQFELILKICSIICAYGGRRRRVGQGCPRGYTRSLWYPTGREAERRGKGKHMSIQPGTELQLHGQSHPATT